MVYNQWDDGVDKNKPYYMDNMYLFSFSSFGICGEPVIFYDRHRHDIISQLPNSEALRMYRQ